MAIFNSYVSLPEGKLDDMFDHFCRTSPIYDELIFFLTDVFVGRWWGKKNMTNVRIFRGAREKKTTLETRFDPWSQGPWTLEETKHILGKHG